MQEISFIQSGKLRREQYVDFDLPRLTKVVADRRRELERRK
jgi:hypothetical protein